MRLNSPKDKKKKEAYLSRAAETRKIVWNQQLFASITLKFVLYITQISKSPANVSSIANNYPWSWNANIASCPTHRIESLTITGLFWSKMYN